MAIYSGQAYYFNSNLNADDGRTSALSGETAITQVEVSGYGRTAFAQLVSVASPINASLSGGTLAVDLSAASGDNIALGSSGGTLAGVSTNLNSGKNGLNVSDVGGGYLSVGNSSTTPLAISTDFTGTTEETYYYGSISVSCTVSPTTANGTLNMEFSTNGTNWDRVVSIPITSDNAANTIHNLIPIMRYFRVRYVNALTAQTSFRLQTIYNASPRIALPTTRLDQTPTQYTDAINTRSVLYGKLDSDKYQSVNVSENGHLETEIHGPVSAFGELISVGMSPRLNGDFTYGINTDQTSVFYSSGATATVTDSLLTLTTSAMSYNAFTLRSKRSIKYQPGQGSEGRFTAMWSDTGVTGNNRFVGFGSAESTLGFGTFGSAFCILRVARAYREIRKLTIVSGSSTNTNVTITLDGQPFVVPVTNTSVTTRTAYEISTYSGFNRGYPGWVASALDGIVYFHAGTAGSKAGTYSASFGSGTGSATFTQITSGATGVTEAIPQASWNVDVCDGSSSASNPSGINLDITKLNVYAIQWTYLGAGNIIFKVMQSDTGEMVVIHRIQYPNTNVLPSLSNTNLPFLISNLNGTNNTAVSISSASFAGFVQGEINDLGDNRNFTRTVVGLTTTLTPIFTIRTALISGTKINTSEVELLQFNASVFNGTRGVEFYIYEQPVLNNTTVFSAFTNSIVEVDVNATSLSGGIQKFGAVAGTGANILMDMDHYNITLEPNNYITIVAKSTLSTHDVSVSLQWIEKR